MSSILASDRYVLLLALLAGIFLTQLGILLVLVGRRRQSRREREPLEPPLHRVEPAPVADYDRGPATYGSAPLGRFPEPHDDRDLAEHLEAQRATYTHDPAYQPRRERRERIVRQIATAPTRPLPAAERRPRRYGKYLLLLIILAGAGGWWWKPELVVEQAGRAWALIDDLTRQAPEDGGQPPLLVGEQSPGKEQGRLAARPPAAAEGEDDSLADLAEIYTASLTPRLPMDVGPGIRMVGAASEGTTISLDFRVDGTLTSEDEERLRSELEPRFRDSVCNSEPAENNIHGLNNRGVVFRISYSDSQDKQLATMTIEPEFCAG